MKASLLAEGYRVVSVYFLTFLISLRREKKKGQYKVVKQNGMCVYVFRGMCPGRAILEEFLKRRSASGPYHRVP